MVLEPDQANVIAVPERHIWLCTSTVLLETKASGLDLMTICIVEKSIESRDEIVVHHNAERTTAITFMHRDSHRMHGHLDIL